MRASGRPFTLLAGIIAAANLSCPESGFENDFLGSFETESIPEQEPEELTALPATGQFLIETPVEEEEVEVIAEPIEPSIDLLTMEDPVEAMDPEEARPEPQAEPEPPAQEEVFELVALRKETWIFAEPNWNARRIGYLRSGTVVRRDERPAGFKNCKNGWFRIEPEGFVCAGKSASLESYHPMVEAAGRMPDRSKPMPYAYVMSESPPPPLYVRLPSEEEQRQVEPDLRKVKSRNKDLSDFEPFLEPIPGSLLYDRSLPSPHAKERDADILHTGHPVNRSGFGLLHVFSWTDRYFGVTTDLNLIPLDRTRFIKPSTMQGIHLVEDQGLPVAFVQSRVARLYRIDLETRAVKDVGEVGYREGFSLTGRRIRLGEHVYLETREGTFIRENSRVVVIPTLKSEPTWAKPGRKWISVSILRQALVAYEGTRPVFATLVSTGADGLGDPKETYSTVLGAFMIHTKHVTVKMSNDEVGDTYDLQDVPYVQFFHEGYALHGAYWHDGFGTPRSHGCINLSPYDASWVFAWTDPEVPEGWHGKLQLRGGTLLHIHP